MPTTPRGVITPTEAQELNDNWTDLRKGANDRAAGQSDNRSSWYSIQDLKDYIALVEDENPDATGIRFYLGVETTKEDPKGLTTIFIIPTEEIEGENKDIATATGLDRGTNGVPPGAPYPQ